MGPTKVAYVDLVAQHAAIRDELIEAVDRVLAHGQFVLGPEVAEFERRMAEYCSTRYAVGVGDGTSALFLAMTSLGIGPGDEVITAPNSFLASAATIALTGARPVFVDVADDYNIDPDAIAPAITARTKAILPVHLTGRPAAMNPIMEIADKHGLHVIEDCAQAVGAEYHGRRVGSFGIAGCFSLHPLKTLNAVGDGGVVTTNDETLYERLRKARNHGLRNRDESDFFSHNSRLDTIQAAMLLVKLKYLGRWTEARRAHARFYAERLEGVVGVPVERPHERSVYHTFVVTVERRDQLRSHLLDRGIDSKIHYPIPIHLQAAAQGLGRGRGSFPVAEAQAGKILSLPVYPELTQEQTQYVVDALRAFYDARST